MERNRDSRKTAGSAVNGIRRRLQRVATIRDSAEDFHEKVRLRDREKSIKKDRDRELLKRRRVDRSTENYRETEIADASDEEYYEEEEDYGKRINRVNHRGVRKIRSSPAVLRAAVDEVIGVVVPRRTRSCLAKRLYEQLDSGFGDDIARRRSLPASVSVFDGDSPTSSLKKKMNSAVETRTRVMNRESHSRPPSIVQKDIEIEVAEALFDLMQQSQSQKVDREFAVGSNNDDLKRLTKAEIGKDENNAFSVQIEKSRKVNAETNVVASMEEISKEDRVEVVKLPDGPYEPVTSVNKENVGSSKDSESPSCVKANACEIQDLIMSKAKYVATENGNQKMLDKDRGDDLNVTSSTEKDAGFDMATDSKFTIFHPKLTTQNLQKKSDPIPNEGSAAFSRMPKKKEGSIMSNRPDCAAFGKSMDDVIKIAKQHQQNQAAASFFPMPAGMSSWPGILPYPGYTPAPQAVLPVEASARPSTGIQLPQFKASQPRQKRCATHQYIASNIHHHQKLMKESLNVFDGKSIPGKVLVGTVQGGQSLANTSGVSEKDMNGAAAAFSNSNGSVLHGLHHNPNQAVAYSLLNGPGFIFPFGYTQAMGITQANRPGPSPPLHSTNNSSLLSTSQSFKSTFSSKDGVASYMATLQNNGCVFPVTANISTPSLKGGVPSQSPAVPFFYPAPAFNASQNQQHLCQITSTSNSSSTQKPPQIPQLPNTRAAEKNPSATAHSPKPEKLQQSSNSSPDSSMHQFVKLPNGQTCSFPVHLMNFSAAISPHMMSNVAVGNKNDGDTKQQDTKNRVDLVPQAFNAFSFCSDLSRNDYHLHAHGNKNSQASEGKSSTTAGNQSLLFKSGPMDKTSKSDGTNHLPSIVGNKLIASSSSANTSSGVSVTLPNIQLHHQQQQLIRQLYMQQVHGTTTQDGASTFSNINHGSNFAGSFPSNNTPPYRQFASPSLSSSFDKIAQQKGSKGPTNISFQVPQVTVGSASNLRNGSTLSSQETEAASSQTQKMSPACRRNVPSFLSTCNGQVSELKN